ncbi:mechanosensitive ion channel domain-containing protein [uncultured Campylobacter sp.]|uniref:mechanosensitive ion channel domain-containing protein n=1 Tax=uncultured Campylobacter sp. TaxID=218934 RepID=UPI00262CF925|nr:mechanosensitive ion channel domain-containing protein [uncultured Campylobacter sp.]
MAFVIIAAIANLGVETSMFVAALGAIGLAIGMAFKDTFSNIGAGFLIIFLDRLS